MASEPDAALPGHNMVSRGNMLSLLCSNNLTRYGFEMHEMVHKMSYQPADVYKMKGRGALIPGNFADMVLFDGKAIDEEPSPVAKHVFTNGKQVIRNGKPTGILPGNIIRRSNVPKGTSK